MQELKGFAKDMSSNYMIFTFETFSFDPINSCQIVKTSYRQTTTFLTLHDL